MEFQSSEDSVPSAFITDELSRQLVGRPPASGAWRDGDPAGDREFAPIPTLRLENGKELAGVGVVLDIGVGLNEEGMTDHETALTCLRGLSRHRADDYDSWLRVGMALHAAGAPCDDWDRWSQSSAKYKPGDCAKRWAGFGRGDGVTVNESNGGGSNEFGVKFVDSGSIKRTLSQRVLHHGV